MDGLLDDAALAERILAHAAAGTTDLAEGTWREPVESYRSEPRLRAEIQTVLRRTPAAFCPSAAIAEPGRFFAREAAGVPLVAVRDAGGAAHVFRNACRHRGAPVAAGEGCAKAFVCRYHGWTYGLDGRLLHVPHEHGFPDLEPGRRALVPVPAIERGGIVFVVQEPDGDPADALADLPDLLGSDLRLFASREAEIPANWKIFLESFLEGYHIRTTHPTTFYPFGYDNLNVVEHFGRNSRVTFPFRRIAEQAARPPAERRIAGAVTSVYHLFPNAIVTALSHHVAFVVLEPVSVSATRVVTWSLTNRPEGSGDAERDAAFVNQGGAAEDVAMACAIQRGLASGANESFVHGRFEGAIAHFHRALAAALGESAAAERQPVTA
jgi:phenylpropionate dioxygenase-like ring-hydroxylating dioxygenase large terminal subunit